MDRRRFLNSVAFGLLMAPLTVRAQQSDKVWRIGLLRQGIHALDHPFWDAMYGLDWIEGRNVIVEPRYATTRDELALLAAELVALNVDVIIAQGLSAAIAAKHATKTIPIVFTLTVDPVEEGLVAGIAQPGGNVTGFTYGDYAPKILEILKLALPKVARVAIPASNPGSPILTAAKVLHIEVNGFAVKSADGLIRFFATAKSTGYEAVLFPETVSWFGLDGPRLAAEAVKSHLPLVCGMRWLVEAGALLSYGPFPQHLRAIARQVDKIFKGAKPADIPVQLPTKFEMFINMKTANALGITISKSAQALADVILR